MKYEFEHNIIKSALERANISFKDRAIVNIETDADGIHFCLKGKPEHYLIRMHDVYEQSESSWVKYSLFKDDTVIISNGMYVIEDEEVKKGLNKWLLAGVGIGLAIATAVAYKIVTGKEIKEPASVYEYTKKWIDSLSLEELAEKRELVRLERSNPNRDNSRYDDLTRMLNYFDKRTRTLKYGDNPPVGFPVHREHGWYLPNDD